ncbi:SusC/RagA family TonB-linked outer membrane protein [Solitalea sp. MAHUQ-68]|uniref:SusC/RagA family TonB-linked outer membrane protein n=1 Tax=Solitalea agri TaxID=2953739 RepID=A0A9X2F3U5_9SPHI|nr:SusC/RagA family TonB-linked outer membrane protein [Solitalea agri]MCO4294269.1 SusC/RagA family TonB-linked outer membrane protein [Solitalea agri]
MKQRLLNFLLVGLVFMSLQVFAQQKEVTGTVISAEDNQPIPGVSVLIKGTAKGTQTDVNGFYKISVEQGQTLVFNFVGTKEASVTVGSSSKINVTLQSDAKALGEVVVTALGQKQNKRSLAYAVQEIKGSDLNDGNQTNALNALKAKAAGVQITSSGGAAGAGSRIQIRGVNSLNPSANNQPLFIIDGVPVSNETDNFGGSSGDSFQNTNRFSDINPDDIESMTILKGPSASVLYGLRAANGAVVVTTKSGKAGKASMNYKVSYSFDDVTKTPPIQTRYGNGNNGMYTPSVNTWGPLVNGAPTYNPYDMYFQTGHQLQNSFTMSGGSEKATYFTSISNSSQTGVAQNSDYGKTSIRLAGTLRASDQVKFDASANYIRSGGTNPRVGVSSGAIFYLMKHTNTVDPSDYLNADGTEKVYNAAINNPFYFSENAFLNDNVNRVIGNLGVDYSPLKWLSLNYKIGLDNYSDFRRNYNETGLLISSLGSMGEQRIGYSEVNSNFIAKANQRLSENWNANFLIGQSYTNIKRSSLSTSGSQAIVPGLESINNYVVYQSSNYPSEKNMIGVFGDVKVDYKNQLFLSLTGRNDWSSTLPKQNRSFFYPSASVAYVFTELPFLKNNSILSFGKFRASYAEVGKDADPYQIGVYYSTLQAYSGVSGIYRNTSLGFENLKPERTKGIEFGGEFRFLNDRITLDANYAIANSIDQIVPVPVSYSSGYDVYVTNAGQIRNKTLEFVLNATLLNKSDFKWDLNANWAQTKGRVISMPPGVNEIIFNPATPWNKQIIKTGGRPGDWYGWPLTRAQNGQLLIGADGYPIVPSNLDQNTLIGNAYPDWTGGLGSSLSYKGLSFSFLFNFRKGGFVNDIVKWQRYTTGIGAETEMRNTMVVFKGVVNKGTTENPVYEQNTKQVMIDQNFYNAAFRYRLSSENNGFQDASWIRLQNVSLGYNLPTTWLNKTFVKSASVSVTANNLWVTTPFVGFDPESSTYGAGSNAVGYVGTGVPSTRNVYVAFNVNF